MSNRSYQTLLKILDVSECSWYFIVTRSCNQFHSNQAQNSIHYTWSLYVLDCIFYVLSFLGFKVKRQNFNSLKVNFNVNKRIGLVGTQTYTYILLLHLWNGHYFPVNRDISTRWWVVVLQEQHRSSTGANDKMRAEGRQKQCILMKVGTLHLEEAESWLYRLLHYTLHTQLYTGHNYLRIYTSSSSSSSHSWEEKKPGCCLQIYANWGSRNVRTLFVDFQ